MINGNENDILKFAGQFGWEPNVFQIYLPVSKSPPQKKPVRSEIAVYATYQELYPGQPNSINHIKETMQKYQLKELVFWLSRLNFIFSPHYYAHDDFLKKIALETFQAQGKRIPASYLSENRVFFTKQQMLSNIKLALAYGGEDGKFPYQHVYEETGEMLFRITDFLDPILKSQTEKLSESTIQLIMLRNITINAQFNLHRSLSRQGYIFNRLGKRLKVRFDNSDFTLNQLFKSRLGVNFNDYTITLFAFWAYYKKDTDEKRKELINKAYVLTSDYFEKASKFTSTFKKSWKKTIQLISNTFSGFQEEIKREGSENFFSLEIFCENPILRDDWRHVLIDEDCLEWKISFGSFWQLFGTFKTQSERKEFKSYWGRLFERYVNDLLHSAIPKKSIVSEIKGEESGGVDFIIQIRDTLILIEVTVKRLPLRLIKNLKDEEVRKKLEEILVKDERNRGKAYQLYELKQKISKGDFWQKKLNLKEVKRIIPIMIFEENIVHGDIGWKLCKDILEKSGISKDFIDDLWLLSVDDLEMLVGEIERGTDIVEFLYELKNAGHQRKTLRNFYWQKKNQEVNPTFVNENFEKYALNYEGKQEIPNEVK